MEPWKYVLISAAAVILSAIILSLTLIMLAKIRSKYFSPSSRHPSSNLTNPLTPSSTLKSEIMCPKKGEKGYEDFQKSFVFDVTPFKKANDQSLRASDRLLNIPALFLSALSCYDFNYNSNLSYNTSMKHLADLLTNVSLDTPSSLPFNSPLDKIAHEYDVKTFQGLPNKEFEDKTYAVQPLSWIRSKMIDTYISSPEMKKEFVLLPIKIQALLIGIIKITNQTVATALRLFRILPDDTIPNNKDALKRCIEASKAIYRVLIKYLRTNQFWEYSDDKTTLDSKHDICKNDWEILLNRYFDKSLMVNSYNDEIKKPDMTVLPNPVKKMLDPEANDVKSIGDYIERFTIVNEKFPDYFNVEPAFNTEDAIEDRQNFIRKLFELIDASYASGTGKINDSDDIAKLFIKGKGYTKFTKAIENSGGAVMPDTGSLSEWYFGNNKMLTDNNNKHFHLNKALSFNHPHYKLYDRAAHLKYINNYRETTQETQKAMINSLLCPKPMISYLLDGKISKFKEDNNSYVSTIMNKILAKIKPTIDIMQMISLYFINSTGIVDEDQTIDNLKSLGEVGDLAKLIFGNKILDTKLTVSDKLNLLQSILIHFIMSQDMTSLFEECKSVEPNDKLSGLLDHLTSFFLPKLTYQTDINGNFHDYQTFKQLKAANDNQTYNSQAEKLFKNVATSISGSIMSSIITHINIKMPDPYTHQKSKDNIFILAPSIYDGDNLISEKDKSCLSLVSIFNTDGILINKKTKQDKTNKDALVFNRDNDKISEWINNIAAECKLNPDNLNDQDCETIVDSMSVLYDGENSIIHTIKHIVLLKNIWDNSGTGLADYHFMDMEPMTQTIKSQVNYNTHSPLGARLNKFGKSFIKPIISTSSDIHSHPISSHDGNIFDPQFSQVDFYNPIEFQTFKLIGEIIYDVKKHNKSKNEDEIIKIVFANVFIGFCKTLHCQLNNPYLNISDNMKSIPKKLYSKFSKHFCNDSIITQTLQDRKFDIDESISKYIPITVPLNEPLDIDSSNRILASLFQNENPGYHHVWPREDKDLPPCLPLLPYNWIKQSDLTPDISLITIKPLDVNLVKIDVEKENNNIAM